MKGMLDKVTKTGFRFGDLRDGRNQDGVIETEPSPDDPTPAQNIIQAAVQMESAPKQDSW